MPSLLGLFAKAPLAGQVKTRLAEATTPDWARRVAEAFLVDSLSRFRAVESRRAIVFAPPTSCPYFAGVAQGEWDLIPQGEGDLGERLRRFFLNARRSGHARVIAVGADSPTLPMEYVERAFTALATCDVVIGPACDGGYYLIGSRTDDVTMFDAIPWSTPGVLEATIDRLAKTTLRLTLLPIWYDVDTADDLAHLRGHVLAMRHAGLDPGVPCVERLMKEDAP